MLLSFPRRAGALVLFAAIAAAQGPEPIDQEAIAFLREQGLSHSRVMEHLSWICDVHGPRLTGSPNLRQAQHWARATFEQWGLANSRLERWGPFGRGWRCDRMAMHVVGDNPWPVIAYPKAWSPSLAVDGAEVVLVAELDADTLRGLDLKHKIVFLDAPRPVREPFTPESKRFTAEDLLAKADQAPPPRPELPGARGGDPRAGFQRREQVLRILADKRPLAICDRGSKGDYGTVFVQGASALPREGGGNASARDKGAEVLPQFTLSVEHYNRICRLLDKGQTVRLHVDLQASYFEDELDDYNVTAEIPGTDPTLKDQVVMLGGHFDSWHTGTGCTDNGAGSAVAMEATRLLAEWCKQRGQGPRRTIRVALWSGEEQGLLGSRAYVQQHFGPRGQPTAEHAKLAGYFNLDNGTGRIRGIYLQGNEACAPIFRAWLRPFHDLAASTVTLDNTGGTDHLAFDGVGLPGFQFVQDPISYDTKTHHSNMDVWDHGVAEDLQQAAVIEAAFAWHAAQREQMLPRKPLPAGGDERPRRRGGD